MADREREAEVARRLEEALHQELGRGHVDVAELLRGTRRRTRRERVRRTAVLAAAAVLVAAVPVGVALAQRDGGSSGAPAAGGASGSAPVVTTTAPPSEEPTAPRATESATATQDATQAPTATPGAVPSPVLRYGIPAAVMPTADEIGRNSEVLDESDYANGPTLMGQGCGELPEARRPAERRTLATSDDARGSFQVNIVVTGWRDSRAAFRSLVENAGACRLPDAMTWEARPSAGPDDWSATGTGNGLQYGFAASRLEGEVIVAVTVIDADTDSALAEADRVLGMTVKRAILAGIAVPSS